MKGLATDKEWVEIVKEINQYKDDIKESAQKIVSSLNNSKSLIDIESEFLEILNALGKIGTMTSNASRVNAYACALTDSFTLSRSEQGKKLGNLLIIDLLNRVCLISFDVKKRGKGYEITIPKIDVNFVKVG